MAPFSSSAITRVTSLAAGAWGDRRALLQLAVRHTGLPAVVIAGLALVVGWRLAKRWASFAVEALFVTAVLVILSFFQVIRL